MQRVRDLMSRRVITIPDDMEVGHICGVLFKNSLSGVPVLSNKNKLVGFVSERDIIKSIASGCPIDDKRARDIMSKRVATVSEDTFLTEVVKIFTSNPFKHLPVVKRGEIVGVISRKDVVGKILKG